MKQENNIIKIRGIIISIIILSGIIFGTSIIIGSTPKKLCTYSESHRAVSEAVKKEVCVGYQENCKGTKEFDHFFSIALGGSNDISNLWAQEENVICNGKNYGFRTKDILETYLVAQMKSGKMTPPQTWDCLIEDWADCYNKLIGDKFGYVYFNDSNNMGNFSDNEDIIE